MVTELRRHDASQNMSRPDPITVPTLLRPFVALHRTALGIAGGVVLGGWVFLLTAILLLKGGDVIGPNLALLGQYFVGYTVTWPGSLIGLLWGFAVGFVLGWGFAFSRNLIVRLWLALIVSRAEIDENRDLLDRL